MIHFVCDNSSKNYLQEYLHTYVHMYIYHMLHVPDVYITIIKETNVVIYLPLSCTQNGWTPLMTASFNGHVDIVRILIEAKAQINIQKEV